MKVYKEKTLRAVIGSKTIKFQSKEVFFLWITIHEAKIPCDIDREWKKIIFSAEPTKSFSVN